MKTAQCAPLKHHYEECAERVKHQEEQHGKPSEDCVEECKLRICSSRERRTDLTHYSLPYDALRQPVRRSKAFPPATIDNKPHFQLYTTVDWESKRSTAMRWTSTKCHIARPATACIAISIYTVPFNPHRFVCDDLPFVCTFYVGAWEEFHERFEYFAYDWMPNTQQCFVESLKRHLRSYGTRDISL